MQGRIQKVPLAAWFPVIAWIVSLAGSFLVFYLSEPCATICSESGSLAFFMLLTSPLILAYVALILLLFFKESRVEFSISSSQGRNTLVFTDRKGKEHAIQFYKAELTNHGTVRLIKGRLSSLSIRFDSPDRAEALISELYPSDGNFEPLEGRASILQLDYVTATLLVPLIGIAILLQKEGLGGSSYRIVLGLCVLIVVMLSPYLISYFLLKPTRFLFKVVGNQVIAHSMEGRFFLIVAIPEARQRYAFHISSIKVTDEGTVRLRSRLRVLKVFDSESKNWFFKVSGH
jgi:hypothetical protein